MKLIISVKNIKTVHYPEGHYSTQAELLNY